MRGDFRRQFGDVELDRVSATVTVLVSNYDRCCDLVVLMENVNRAA